jgi:hypothetical protein
MELITCKTKYGVAALRYYFEKPPKETNYYPPRHNIAGAFGIMDLCQII